MFFAARNPTRGRPPFVRRRRTRRRPPRARRNQSRRFALEHPDQAHRSQANGGGGKEKRRQIAKELRVSPTQVQRDLTDGVPKRHEIVPKRNTQLKVVDDDCAEERWLQTSQKRRKNRQGCRKNRRLKCRMIAPRNGGSKASGDSHSPLASAGDGCGEATAPVGCPRSSTSGRPLPSTTFWGAYEGPPMTRYFPLSGSRVRSRTGFLVPVQEFHDDLSAAAGNAWPPTVAPCMSASVSAFIRPWSWSCHAWHGGNHLRAAVFEHTARHSIDRLLP